MSVEGAESWTLLWSPREISHGTRYVWHREEDRTSVCRELEQAEAGQTFIFAAYDPDRKVFRHDQPDTWERQADGTLKCVWGPALTDQRLQPPPPLTRKERLRHLVTGAFHEP